jgi:hypothetical protein
MINSPLRTGGPSAKKSPSPAPCTVDGRTRRRRCVSPHAPRPGQHPPARARALLPAAPAGYISGHHPDTAPTWGSGGASSSAGASSAARDARAAWAALLCGGPQRHARGCVPRTASAERERERERERAREREREREHTDTNTYTHTHTHTRAHTHIHTHTHTYTHTHCDTHTHTHTHIHIHMCVSYLARYPRTTHAHIDIDAEQPHKHTHAHTAAADAPTTSARRAWCAPAPGTPPTRRRSPSTGHSPRG